MPYVRWSRFRTVCLILSAAVFKLDVVFHALIVPDLYEGYRGRPRGEMAELMPFLFLTYVV